MDLSKSFCYTSDTWMDWVKHRVHRHQLMPLFAYMCNWVLKLFRTWLSNLMAAGNKIKKMYRMLPQQL